MEESVHPLIIYAIRLPIRPRRGDLDIVVKVEMPQNAANSSCITLWGHEVFIGDLKMLHTQIQVQLQPRLLALGDQVHHSDNHFVLEERFTDGARRLSVWDDPDTVFGCSKPWDCLAESITSDHVHHLQSGEHGLKDLLDTCSRKARNLSKVLGCPSDIVPHELGSEDAIRIRRWADSIHQLKKLFAIVNTMLAG
jgi:hypothetical protein